MSDAPYRYRPVSELRPNPINPRGPVSDADVADLVKSVKVHGVLQALVALPDGTVVIGHRRLRAAELAGVAVVPVEDREWTPAEQLEVMITENVQRKRLTPSAEGRAYRELLALGLTVLDISRRVTVPPGRVSSRLKLAGFDEETKRLVDDGSVPLGAVDKLARLPSVDRRVAAEAISTRRLKPADLAPKSQAAPAPSGATDEDLEDGPAPQMRQDPARAREIRGFVGAAATVASRGKARERLAERPRRIATFRALGEVMDAVCGHCGRGDDPLACQRCPLAIFVLATAKEAENVRRY